MVKNVVSVFTVIALSLCLFSQTVAASEGDEPDAFAPGMMAAQAGGGVVAGGATIAAGAGILLLGNATESYFLIGTGLVVTFIGPLATIPLGINATGRWSGYDSRHLGAYLGTAALGIPSLIGTGFLLDILDRENLFLQLLVFTVGATAGGVLGYHIQAHRNQGSSPTTTESALTAPRGGPSLVNFQMQF